MKLIKSVFFAGLLLVIVAAGAFAMYNRGAFNNFKIDTAQANKLIEKLPPQLASFFPKQTTEQKTISFDQESAQQQVSILTERSQEVSKEVTKVLGDFVQVNEEGEKQALHEKALEYGQYMYCQQVVEQYEKENSTNN